jgi:hypothetical protein
MQKLILRKKCLIADVSADVEKIKANFGHDAAEKQGAYAKADIKADASKAKADVDNMMEHAKTDMEKEL